MKITLQTLRQRCEQISGLSIEKDQFAGCYQAAVHSHISLFKNIRRFDIDVQKEIKDGTISFNRDINDYEGGRTIKRMLFDLPTDLISVKKVFLYSNDGLNSEISTVSYDTGSITEFLIQGDAVGAAYSMFDGKFELFYLTDSGEISISAIEIVYDYEPYSAFFDDTADVDMGANFEGDHELASLITYAILRMLVKNDAVYRNIWNSYVFELQKYNADSKFGGMYIFDGTSNITTNLSGR